MQKKKKLIIPLITPFVRKKDNELEIRDFQSIEHNFLYKKDEYYIDSRAFFRLKNITEQYSDAVAIAMTTGEGNIMDFNKWKDLVELSSNVFDNEKIIVGILFKTKKLIVRAIEYLHSFYYDDIEENDGINRCFVKCPDDIDFIPFFDEILKKYSGKEYKNNKIHFYLYLDYKKNLKVKNDEVIQIVKNYSNIIVGIKDSRKVLNPNSPNHINQLKRKLNEINCSHIEVYQGWEDEYPSSFKECDGGVFPLANIEPELIRRYIDGKHHIYNQKPDIIIKKIFDRLGASEKWISQIKQAFNLRKEKYAYNEKDFSEAFDLYFKFYSEEVVNNFHVQNFNVNSPLTSMCKTFFSDLLTLQTMYFRSNDISSKGEPQFLFLPIIIIIKDISGQRAFRFSLNYAPNKGEFKPIISLPDTIEKVSQEIFESNYFIESKIFLEHYFEKFIYGENFEPIQDFDIENSAKENNITDKLKSCQKEEEESNRIKHIDITYVSEDSESIYEFQIIYYINPRLLTNIPEYIFKYLARVAAFTKRNKLSVEELTANSIKAAISQVMARNGSHNTGSHVLAKLVTADDITRALDILGSEKVQYKSSLKRYNEDKDYNFAESIEKPFEHTEKSLAGKTLNGFNLLAYFNSYIKTRMDYLADVATSTPTLESTRFLKRDVLAGIDRNRILLNKISGVDAFNYTIIVKNRLKCTCSNVPGRCDCPNNDEDIPIVMPNDLLGQHAFYIIVENIIRNTAKHGGNPVRLEDNINANTDYIFTIEILNDTSSPQFQDYYQVFIYDNCPIKDNSETKALIHLKNIEDIAEQFNNIEPNWPEYISLDKLSSLEAIIVEQAYRLNKKIIDSNGKLRDGAWGLIEMDVSASYLRKESIENCDDSIFDILPSGILKPRKSKSYLYNSVQQKNNPKPKPYLLKSLSINNCLGYRLFLMKPKNYLIILDSESYDIEEERNQKYESELRNYGILVLNPKQFYTNKEVVREIFSYQFLIFEDALFPMNKKTQKRKILYEDINIGALPIRKIALSASINKEKKSSNVTEIIDYLNSKNKEDTLKKLNAFIWPKWINTLLTRRKKDCVAMGWDENMNFEKEFYKRPFLSHSAKNKPKAIFKAVFDDHGINWANFHDADYINPISSRIKITLPNIPENSLDISFREKRINTLNKLQLAESTLTKVAILDERIQVGVIKGKFIPKKAVPIPLDMLLEKIGIYVPKRKQANLNEVSFEREYKKILSWTKKISKDLDFLIIHMGIIEKLMKIKKLDYHDKNLINQYIKEEFQHQQNIHLTIIITSGRGKPENLPSEYRFINYSSISNYILEDRNKFMFINCLNNARRI